MLDFIGINLPHPYLVEPAAQIPLGLLYVIGGAVQAGFTAKIYDGTGQTPARVARDIDDARAYGLSATVVDYETARQLADSLHAVHPDAAIILGGPIETARAEFDLSMFDAVVKGQADAGIARILEDVYAGRLAEFYDFSADPPDPDHVDNPYQYWTDHLGGRVVSSEDYLYAQSAILVTSRGCPHSCCFCCARYMCGGKVRFRAMDAVFRDVEYLVQRGVRVLRLSDENFTTRPARVVEWCERIRPYHEQQGVVWRPSFRADCQDAGLFREMKASGCIEASIGAESADPAVLQMIGKGTTVEDNWKCLSALEQAGIKQRLLFMVGCPGTNAHTLERNTRFLLDAPYAVASATLFTPLPGTPIWNHPEHFKCDLTHKARHLKDMCFYFYGPEGLRHVEPLIDVWGFPFEDLKNEVETTRGLIYGLGRANTG